MYKFYEYKYSFKLIFLGTKLQFYTKFHEKDPYFVAL